MDDCVFCNIANKQIDSKIEYEDGEVMVIRDILPKAPVHLLVIPKRHIVSVSQTTEVDDKLLGKIILIAKKMAEKFGIAETGYKLVFNVGKDGGMVVPHLHLHLMGGKNLGE